MKRRAVFFDRDGTLNVDTGYLKYPEHVRLFHDVVTALRFLKTEMGFVLIVISNQSGIGKGILTDEDVCAVNEKVNELLGPGAAIDAFYFCPHHPEMNEFEPCTCRKPSPLLLQSAMERFDIDASGSFMIGDRETDILAGEAAGVKTILVRTGSGEMAMQRLREKKISPDYFARNLTDAVQHIKKDFNAKQH